MTVSSSPENEQLLTKSNQIRLNIKKNRKKLGLYVVLILIILLFIKYHFQKAPFTKPAVAIVATEVQKMDVPIYIYALGNVISTYTISVKTQVSGLLMKVLYQEGQRVKKGELLAEIDDRPFQAQLIEYQGQLLRDQALLANALVDLKRYQKLWKQDSISQQTLATQESLVKQYEGAVKIDKGLIQSTQVNLNYCHIISPIDGRVGLRLVDPGNYVQPSDSTGIAVITSLNPVTVIFSIPEDDISKLPPSFVKNPRVEVYAFDRQENKLLDKGIILAMDNQIDTSTGTVKLRAQFNNTKNNLYPNQFVNIKVLIKNLHQAIVIPTAAIQHSTTGDFVYVVNPDSTVTTKAVKISATYDDFTVINEGLGLKQKVVVDGAEKLTEGAMVKLTKTVKV